MLCLDCNKDMKKGRSKNHSKCNVCKGRVCRSCLPGERADLGDEDPGAWQPELRREEVSSNAWSQARQEMEDG